MWKESHNRILRGSYDHWDDPNQVTRNPETNSKRTGIDGGGRQKERIVFQPSMFWGFYCSGRVVSNYLGRWSKYDILC